jgi:hypothetical protein
MRFRLLFTLVTCVLVSATAVADCTFSFLSETTTPAGTNAGDMASGDFNHDGQVDLAVVNRQSSNIAILLGQQGGTFAAPSFVATTGSHQADVAAAYINGDNHLDLLTMGGSITYDNVTYSGMYVQVLLGNGAGGFTLGDSEWIGYHPGDIEPGDFDNDGDTDFAVSREGNNPAGFHLIVNLGGGNIAQKSAPTVTDDGTVGSSARDVAAGDFDGDGNLDVVISDGYNDKLVFFFGIGDGTFTRSTNFIDPTATAGLSDAAWGLASADFNGDGYDDVAVSNRDWEGLGRGSMAVVLSNGTARTFAPAVQHGSIGSGGYEIAVADVSGDGIDDVIVAGSFSIYVFRGNGDGTFNAKQEFGSGDMALEIVDIDHDGGLDIAASHFSPASVGILQNVCGQVALELTSSANPASHGSNFTLTASLASNPAATGTLTLSRTGAGTLASTNLSAATSVSSTQMLEIGTYEFVATYSGDSRFPETTRTLTQTVQTAPFGPPPGFVATSSGASPQLTWFATSGTSKYEIWRDSGVGFGKIGETTNSFFVDTTAPASKALLYKVRAISPTSIASAFSNSDFTLSHVFTDENLVAGTTTVKNAHITEVRDAANGLRARAGLPAASWNMSTTVLAAQFNEVRTAINEARTALGAAAMSFADTLTRGVPIRRIHMLELRSSMR